MRICEICNSQHSVFVRLYIASRHSGIGVVHYTPYFYYYRLGWTITQEGESAGRDNTGRLKVTNLR